VGHLWAQVKMKESKKYGVMIRKLLIFNGFFREVVKWGRSANERNKTQLPQWGM
jgi:hypothetical protein